MNWKTLVSVAWGVVCCACGSAHSEEWRILEENRVLHGGGVQRLALSPDGKLLVSASKSNLRLFSLDGVKAREQVAAKGIQALGLGGVRSLAFLPDGKTLAAGVGGNTLRILDIGDRIEERLKLQDQNGNVQSLAVTPDQKTLAAGSDDMTVLFYDITGPRPKERFRIKVKKANFGVKTLHFTPDGQRLVLACGNGAVQLWDLSGPEPKETAKAQVRTNTFQVMAGLSPDGKNLAIADDGNRTIHLWEATADGFVPKHSWTKAHANAIGALVWSPNGKYLATADKDGRIVLWNTATREKVFDKQKSGHFESAVLDVPPENAALLRLIVANWTGKGEIDLYLLGAQQ
ncbi:MAG: hypothetical protein L0215_18675 [Gemmataceae bacterium]|nr:hypothetical protein [Gemmataceae bacterium]